jgi:hypothetical protein
MISCLRSFIIALTLLQFCEFSAEVQWLNFDGRGNQAVIAWADAASGEEDSKEFEDDDMAGHSVPALVGDTTSCQITDLGFLAFDDHVGEMFLPPPLA